MKAMILAAGQGVRMRPLTDHTPKALIKVGDACLIEHHLRRIRDADISEVVVNLGRLGATIREQLKDGDAYGVQIAYSDEGSDILETGGGIVNALPLLGGEPFFVVNADVYTDYKVCPTALRETEQAHLIMVDNPAHNPDGDFGLADGLLTDHSDIKLTFSGMGYYRAALFSDLPPQHLPLVKVLKPAIEQGLIGGEHYRGKWIDVGTMERLDLARASNTSNKTP